MECSYKKCCHYCTVSLVPATSIILAIVFFGGFIALPIVYTTNTVRIQYGLVIDAGSSHTSLFAYSWNVTTNSTGLVQQVFTNSTTNPLTSYASQPSNAGPNIAALANSASPHVRGDQRYIQLFLGATAGMRLLKDTNSTVANKIIQSVTSSLKINTQFNFTSAEIISGIEEGLYGWVTLNYLNKKVPPKGQDTTTGVLDMGGASLQIASEYSGGILPGNNCSNSSVTLYGRKYNLYACSYLCYGRDRAQSRLLDYLISRQNKTIIQNPCFPEQYTHTYLNSEIYDGWCVTTQDNTASSYTFSGTGNVTECYNSVSDVFSDAVPSTVIPIQGNFVGISTFYYAASYVYNSSTPPPITSNLDNYSTSVFNFCGIPLSGPSNSSYTGDACFNAMYTLFMLQNVLGFGNATNWTLTFNNKVNGEDVGWSLGYMLNRTVGLQTFVTTPFLLADLVVGMIVLAILCVVFVAFFIFTFLPCRKAITHNSGYTTLS